MNDRLLTKHLLILTVAVSCLRSYSQTITPSAGLTTFHAEAKLVLVDIIPEYQKTRLRSREPVAGLRKEDLQIFDNGKEMPIRSFDAGSDHNTRPITLWLIVQCPLGLNPRWTSGFMLGRTDTLKPALADLGPNDVVGVAHWCDDGGASIDLQAGRDSSAALKEVENQLNKKVSSGINRIGELAMQRLIRMVVEETHSFKPERLPVLLFLYGDRCSTYVPEAEKIIEAVLETSGIVFGMSNGGFIYAPGQLPPDNKIPYLVHYYAGETGGEYYTAIDPERLSSALEYILYQLHTRYTIGFAPNAIDGKRHRIKVELTREAKKRYLGVDLRFRQQYIAVRQRP